MNTILTQTGQQLVIRDIDHKIEEYYGHNTIYTNEYRWMPQLSPHIQELWTELCLRNLHTATSTILRFSTSIHIYNVQKLDEVYTSSVNVTHHSPMYQNGETQWFRIFIHRYPNEDSKYGIECTGYNEMDGKVVKIHNYQPLDLFRNRDRFMDYLHRLCVELSKQTLDVEGKIQSVYNRTVFANPNR